MAGPEPGDIYRRAAARRRVRGSLRRGSAAARASACCTMPPAGRARRRGRRDLRRGARDCSRTWATASRRPRRRWRPCMEPFHTIVLGQTAALSADARRPSASTLLEPTHARGRDRRRAHRRGRVRAGRRRRRGADGRAPEAPWRRSSSSSPPCSRARRCRSASSRSTRRGASCWRAYYEWHSYTVPVQRHGPARALAAHRHDRRAASRSGCRSSGPPGADALVLALGAALRAGARVNAADLGVVEAARAARARPLSAAELTRACLARIRERDGVAQPRGRPGLDQRLGARLRGARRSSAAAEVDERAPGGGALPPLGGIPIGLKDLYGGRRAGPLTASSSLLDERARARLRRLGTAARPGA